MKRISALSLLFCSVIAQAQTPSTAPLQPGFYLYQNQTLLSVYSDLVSGSKGKKSAFYTIDSKGTGKALPSAKKFTAANDYLFLGATQKEAAMAMGRNPASFADTVYLAHRGTSQIPVLKSKSVYAGNTKGAMNLALQSGYSGFEFDVQLTRDKKFVVSHDEDLSVSSDCSGKVINNRLVDLARCKIQYTPLLPEEKILRSPAEVPQSMSTLSDIFQTYLTDPRVKNLVVDVKPGDSIDDQIAAFDELLSQYSEIEQAKIIFLIRDLNIETRLKALGKIAPMYALEGDSGWEPLQGKLDPNAHAVSLSLGIGLGIDPAKGSGILSILMSLPEFIKQGTLNGWRGGSVDISAIQWLPATQRKFLELENVLETRHIPVVGWTVNSADKIKWLREQTPKLPVVLSDLPYSEILKLELAELEQGR
jgi:glycerophosphoryl diester phosphodiesterase